MILRLVRHARTTAVSGVLAVVAAGLAVLAGSVPAHAAPYFESAPSVQIGYTDSAQPTTAFDRADQVNMPLGTRVDENGTAHTSRVYATYDLRGYRDLHFISAILRVREINVADCAKRAVEAWQTRPISATPTWRRAPAELSKLADAPPPTFCPNTLPFDVTSAVRDAIIARQNKVTIELRVPAALEADPTYFRELYWFSSAVLTIGFNHVPTIDNANLVNAGYACGKLDRPRIVGAFADTLQARASDGDSNDRGLTLNFGVWPITDPGAVTTMTGSGVSGSFGTGTVPAGVLVSGTTYAWHVQATDGLDTSPWSKTCYFTYDGVRPSSPTVTSSNYPQNGTAPLGEPGVFTFSGNGDPDVAGFAFVFGTEVPVGGCPFIDGRLVCSDPFDGPNVVRARDPGGTARVKLSPPSYGFTTLTVLSIDRAGNGSDRVRYEFFAPFSEPTIAVSPATPQWNQPVTFTFTPQEGVRDVTSYEYAIDFGPAQTVNAGPDGRASITFTITNTGGVTVTAKSVSRNGFVSTAANYQRSFFQGPGVSSDIYSDDGNPHGGVGVPGTFTFSPPPGWLEVKEYTYYPPDGTDFVTVPAGPDGRATITFTPQTSGELLFIVDAVRPNGTPSFNQNFYFFVVGESP